MNDLNSYKEKVKTILTIEDKIPQNLEPNIVGIYFMALYLVITYTNSNLTYNKKRLFLFLPKGINFISLDEKSHEEKTQFISVCKEIIVKETNINDEVFDRDFGIYRNFKRECYKMLEDLLQSNNPTNVKIDRDSQLIELRFYDKFIDLERRLSEILERKQAKKTNKESNVVKKIKINY